MLNSPFDEREDEITEIVAGGPRGALALAGIATFIVVAIWFAFYLLVFMPRGPAQ
jgi:hypothetical protein